MVDDPHFNGDRQPPPKFKLQKLELPSFDGDVLKWMSFSNSFQAAVHSNTSLTNSERLQYLKSSLTGEASSRIDAFQIDEASFQPAWEILTKRYQDKKAIINAILKRLLLQSSVQQDSATSLRKFVDVINECLRSLQVLTVPTSQWDPILLFLLVEKIDVDTRKQWELSPKDAELPTIAEFIDFIELRAKSLSSLPTAKAKIPFKGFNNKPPAAAAGKVHHVAGTACVNCPSETHPLFACPIYRKASVQERWEQVKKAKACFNCTLTGHGTQDCKAGTCKTCSRKHHTILHADKAPAKKEENPPHPLNVAHSAVAFSNKESSQVLLGTALLKIPDAKGTLHSFRALIDPGSQITLISENCKQQVGLKSFKTQLPLTGVGNVGLGTASQLVKFNLLSCIDSSFSLCVNAVVLPRVTGPLPNAFIATRNWSHINGLQLADPTFHTPSPVDILLGADVCASIMKDGMRRGPGGTPTAWNSSLGWILIGAVCPTPSVKVHLTEPQLGDALERFWHQEEIPASTILTPEEKACEDHFAAHHVRVNNRYVVELPFKEDPSVLGSSRYTALRRLYSLERQLLKAPSRYAEYAQFLDICLTLGHMELVPEEEMNQILTYYLPHHAVLKESSTSTKLRVVFSGKDATSTGKSLNDILMVGPKLQPDLITTIIRFRTYIIAITADIVKMYRQVQVAPHHRDYQRIVWRGTPGEPVRDYRLTTVVYGTSSAPYQAVKALQQLALDFKDEFPIASEVILKSFYVDDVLSGASSDREAIQIYNELTKIIEKGGFELRKWASNNSTFLKAVPPEHRGSSSPQIIEEDENIKTLGIRWHPSEDYFSFDVQQYEERVPVTKRTILSDTLKTFDPCGSLAPVTIKPKMFLQKLWKNACKWDDHLPPDTQASWKNFQQEMKGLEELKIPRCINLINSFKYQLHGFCDASEKAFAAAVYLRCEARDGTVQVRLIASKTKVSPIKPIQLPRLELCSSVLLVRLLAIITPALDSIHIEEVHAWSDSNIALCWIAAHPSRWKTFIANRVTEIQEYKSCSWHHVRSEDNPADCASRGITVSELISHPLWWEGPPWLRSSSFPFQFPEDTEPEGALLEEKKQPPLVVHTTTEPSIMEKFSSLTKLKRVTAYCYRFIVNCKRIKEDRLSGPLTVEELHRALCHWVKEVQKVHFQPELNSLFKTEPIPKNSKLRFLNPFIDPLGTLRVGGRIQRAQIPFDKKYPIILPPKNHLTNLILAHEHFSSLHGGAQLMWASISRRFWILNANDVIRQYIRKCIVCFRHRKETAVQMMADLPAARVNRSRAFLNCGVDYAGPFSFRVSKIRSSIISKGWVALFVCFTTRAIHLELVSDASTDTFLAALKRFIARRGICQAIHSDVGTNFKGADNELKRLLKLYKSEDHNKIVAEALSCNNIQWVFNSPASPHMGGLWEAGVKSFKHHLKRVVGTHILTFEEFNTVLCQIESCLNSRPLCPMSTDPSDLSALTPGHFLIGEALHAIPEPNLTLLPENRLSRWQLTQKIVQAVWKRWNTELITRLQQRPLWLSPKPNLEEGTLVLIKDENLPPLRWMLARIIKLHPGKDGHVRIVTVKTKDSELIRPIVKLCPLPIDTVIP